MADLYRAYKLLNSTFDLGLTDEKMVAVEKMAKMAFAKEKQLSIAQADVDKWEFFLNLTPRKEGGHDAGAFDIEEYRGLLPKDAK